MKKKSIGLFLIVLFMAMFFDPITSVAKQESSNLIDGLSYEILYPENQKNKNLGYFDLTMKPGQEQIVSLKLYNSLSKELTVQLRLNTAKTNSIGKVEYGPNELKKDASLTNDFIDIVKGPEKVVIPPKSDKQVDLTITVPKTITNGLIAGGLQLQPVDNKEAKGQGKKDVVVNEFAFLMGVLVRVGETNGIKPELKLNKTYIAFKEGNSHLFINLSNSQPVYLEDISINVQVRKANKQKILFEYTKKEMRMAPNSMIDFPIDLADKGLTAGEYTAKIDVSSKKGGHWSWTDDFTINTLEAKNINQQLIENKTDNKRTIWLFFFILLVSVLLFVLSYKVVKHKRVNERK